MRLRCVSATLLAALVAAAAVGQPAPAPTPTPVIRFPDLAPVPPPSPTPAPSPDPLAIPRLTPDTWYVVDSDVDVEVLAIPDGLLKVSQEAGPLKVRGRFIDGSGKSETRLYKGKNVVTVEVAEKTTGGRATLIVRPATAKSTADWLLKPIDVGAEPPPAPKPDPTPGPGPQPQPTPSGTGAWAIVVVADLTPDAATARLVNGPTLTALKAAGRCRIYGAKDDADVLAKKNYAPLVAEAGGVPALIVLDKTGKKAAPPRKLPADEATLSAFLKGAMSP
ncbi:MAG: hypothetical protein JWO38_6844 [Gemmataceae bacterium]|nr:hypothetical protein [Gemmataceae bacterium]